MLKEIGLITYHAAYNYGSVLQAWATQCKVEQLGYKCKIINYRMKTQKEHYSMIRFTGPRAFINDAFMLTVWKKKKLRAERFENFIKVNMNLTEEKNKPEDINFNDDFSIIISGSDQIWNKYSNELRKVDWKYMQPYLLKGFKGKNISYASSISNMKNDDIMKIIDEIKEFDYLSFREKKSANLISIMTDRDVSTVLDPTFLLDRNQWISSFDLQEKNEEKYVLFYSLTDKGVIKKAINLLNKFRENGYKIKYITPYAKLKFMEEYEDCRDYGPVEFLDAIYNADTIVTDSYHGTILSINLQKEFYSINGNYESDMRKLDILSKLKLERRIINWNTTFEMLKTDAIDYIEVGEKIEKLRKESCDYLIEALSSK